MNDRPDWVLTDAEIEVAATEGGKGSEPEYALGMAQAKKLVEEIAKHVQDRAYRIGFADEVYLDGDFWRQLRREVLP